MIEPFRGTIVIPSRETPAGEEFLVGHKTRGLFAGHVVFPGGAYDFSIPGEIIRSNGAARELREETGISIEASRVQDVGNLFVWGERWAMIKLYRADVTGSDPVETEELYDLEWRSRSQPDFFDGMPEDVPYWFDTLIQEGAVRCHTVWRAGHLASHEIETPGRRTAFFEYLNLTDDKYFV